MTEVEKKGIGKAKIGLAACGVLIVILAISNGWSYTNLQNQINTLNNDKINLQTQMDTLTSEKNSLQNQVNSLQSQVTNYESQIQSLNSQIVTLNSQINSLNAQTSSLQNDLDSLNSEYDNYVANHHYTDEEYHACMGEARFSFYYVEPSEQKFGVYELSDELDGLEWSQPHQAGVFDCSEMSAFLEWHLENEGWHTYIVCGEAPWDGGYHAWLLVETSTDAYMPVESTTIEIVWWDDPYFDNYFIYDNEFETIQEAIAYNESEFDWWK